MSTVPKLYTVDDLESTPDDGQRYEIIGGELIVSPPPSERQQRAQAVLIRLLGNHLNSQRTGRVYAAPTAVRFSLHDQVEPDVVVVLNERRARFVGGVLEGAPNLAIEILSPSNRSYDLKTKYGLYERNGVPEYWIVDPFANTIRQFILRDSKHQEIDLIGRALRSIAVPELAIELAEFFEELEW